MTPIGATKTQAGILPAIFLFLSVFFQQDCHAQSSTCVLGIVNPVYICVNTPVQFLNNTQPINCFPCYQWYLPNSSQPHDSAVNSPTVTYSTPGTYTVCLYGANDSCDIIDSGNVACITIEVQGSIQPAFTPSPNPSCVFDNVLFTNNTIGDNNTIGQGVLYTSWDFGDGNTSSVGFFQGLVLHSYASPGMYTVTLCSGNSCDTVCTSQVITVNGPSPNFTFDASCHVDFANDTVCSNGILSETWDFGDGSPLGTSPNPSHTYALNNHTYTVTHTITTFAGSFSYSTNVIQTGGPDATITGWQTNTCGNGTIQYSSPCDSNIVYQWQALGGSPALSTGCFIDISWNNSNGDTLILTATDPITQCFSIDTMFIPPCCDTLNYLNITNDLASNVLNDPAFFPYVNGSTVRQAPTIVINGIFTIDTPFRFADCRNIWMGPNAVINILPGETLTFDSSEVLKKCDYMWDGIYINGVTAQLNILDSSTFVEAKNLVVSINGGKFFIDNSQLFSNYMDIVVKAYSGNHAGVIRNTTFDMPTTFLLAIPPLPYGHDKTVCGVEIEDNANITVGDPALATYKNTFKNILVDVRTKNSITNVYNCVFSNTTPTFTELTTVPNAGTAVVATGKKSTTYIPTLTVGGFAANQRCTFNTIRIGIEATNFINVNVLNNQLSSVGFLGINIHNDIRSTIILNKNLIQNSGPTGFITGIQIVETQNSNVIIGSNQINQSTVQSAQNGTGIKISLVSPGTVTLNCSGNTINRVRTGILAEDLVGTNTVLISGNTVNFSKPNNAYTSVHAGIILNGCATVRCDTNKVIKSGANPNSVSMRNNLRGIFINNSPSSIVTNNIFRRMGSGIYGYETSSASTLACNTLDHCFNGVFLTGGVATGGFCDIGNQIVDPLNASAATGNTWIANIMLGQQINGAVSPPIFWRWDVVPPTNAANAVTIQHVTYNACSAFFFASPTVVTRDEEVGTLLRTALDTNITSENRYQLYRHAHRKLNQNPTWLNLNTVDDTMYQHFYTSYELTNIGLLRHIEQAADTGNFQFVNTTSGALPVSNLVETNLTTVYGIYSSTWMQGEYAFSQNDSATLMNIASQDPAEGGTGVFSARVMLGLIVDDYGINSQRMMDIQEEEPSVVPSSDISIYPNPSAGSFNLEYGVDDGQKAELEIYDLSGVLVFSTTLAPQQELYTINTTSLTAGVYMLRISVDGLATESKQLVIVK